MKLYEVMESEYMSAEKTQRTIIFQGLAEEFAKWAQGAFKAFEPEELTKLIDEVRSNYYTENPNGGGG